MRQKLGTISKPSDFGFSGNIAILPKIPKIRMHRLLGPVEGSSILCTDPAKSLGNAIVPKIALYTHLKPSINYK